MNLIQLCQNVFGRRVVQCVLQYGTVEVRTQIHDKIMENPISLLLHHHGNYVIQSLIGKNDSLAH